MWILVEVLLKYVTPWGYLLDGGGTNDNRSWKVHHIEDAVKSYSFTASLTWGRLFSSHHPKYAASVVRYPFEILVEV
ncbi:26663_t:CDS:2 [Dentiscutata erythropus]|uniref:26663_t:CDS:1 n=1 Tax=Dentiscutata erythropus TaxID=1348616 RepID=A0A9N9HGN5_9GLOM|nr:26663_t:CDS:2 [Dentiscutata erythropus]